MSRTGSSDYCALIRGHADRFQDRCPDRQVQEPGDRRVAAARWRDFSRTQRGVLVLLDRRTAAATSARLSRPAACTTIGDRRPIWPSCSAATAPCSTSRARSRRTACRWSASTRGGSAFSPTSRSTPCSRPSARNPRRRVRHRRAHAARRPGPLRGGRARVRRAAPSTTWWSARARRRA